MLQKKFIEILIYKLGSKNMAALFVEEKLNITRDGAYRRLREATAFHPNEIQLLAELLDISLDSILKSSTKKSSFLFDFNKFDLTNNNYLSYFSKIFYTASKAEYAKFYFACKRIPYTYSFFSLGYIEFNIFFLVKVMTGQQPSGVEKFSKDMHKKVGPEIKERRKFGKEYSKLYFQKPSIEIVNSLTFRDDLRKVKYCWDCELFESAEDAIFICESIRFIVNHIKKQAELGKKFIPDQPDNLLADYKLYLCEAVNLEYLFWGDIKDYRIAVFINNSGDYLASREEKFTQRIEQYMKNLIKFSSQISGENERDRNKLFNKINLKIDGLIEYIKR